jgi:hypothetical protein
MLYKTPTLADALIVLGLSGLIGFLGYISAKYTTNHANSELAKLEEELQIERLKVGIEQFKESSVREKALKDARASLTGSHTSKEMRF